MIDLGVDGTESDSLLPEIYTNALPLVDGLTPGRILETYVLHSGRNSPSGSWVTMYVHDAPTFHLDTTNELDTMIGERVSSDLTGFPGQGEDTNEKTELSN